MTALALDRVTKRFYLHHGPRRLGAWLPMLIGRPRQKSVEGRQPFLAVREVSFSVMPGETLGIIGANGSGKSTLLKLIAGIYPPTFGTVQVAGRLVGLLELGAGFHGELTGRQNIFLNGSLYGQSRAYLRDRQEAIIAFADLHEFIDTPLKHYSSGMRVRLGFAIASHLDAEVMLLDEVFAVGDAQFQQKCLGRIRDFQREGRTLLIVSHALPLIQDLSNRALWLHRGRLVEDDDATRVTEAYAVFMRRLAG